MAERFYVNFSPSPGELLLQGPEAHHLATVMRAQPGDLLVLFDGMGIEYPASVIAVGKKSLTVSVGDALSPVRERPWQVVVASAMPKGDRGDFLVEKLVELGATRFIPLKTERSVAIPKVDKLRRAVIEASKQCGRNVLMHVDDVTPWKQLMQMEMPLQRLVAHPASGAGHGPGAVERGHYWPRSPEDIAFAVGPEGGFTDSEVLLALENGWQPVGLGPRILRIETAALALVVGGCGLEPA